MAEFSFSNVLDKTIGAKIMGGYRNEILVIPVAKIVAEPEPAASPETLAAVCELTGTFEFAAGFTPFIIDAKAGSVQYKADNQGEAGAKSFKPSGSFSVKDKQDADGLAAQLCNTDCVLLLQEHDGRQLVVGTRRMPAVVSPAFDSGAKAADARGYAFTYEVDGSFLPKQYMATPIDIDAIRNPVTP